MLPPRGFELSISRMPGKHRTTKPQSLFYCTFKEDMYMFKLLSALCTCSLLLKEIKQKKMKNIPVKFARYNIRQVFLPQNNRMEIVSDTWYCPAVKKHFGVFVQIFSDGCLRLCLFTANTLPPITNKGGILVLQFSDNTVYVVLLDGFRLIDFDWKLKIENCTILITKGN